MLWIIYLLSIARLAFWLCSTTNACVIVRDRSTYFGIRVGVIFTPFAAGYVDQVLAILVNLSMSLAINLHLTLYFIICLRPFLLCFSATRHFIPILLYLVSVLKPVCYGFTLYAYQTIFQSYLFLYLFPPPCFHNHNASIA